MEEIRQQIDGSDTTMQSERAARIASDAMTKVINAETSKLESRVDAITSSKIQQVSEELRQTIHEKLGSDDRTQQRRQKDLIEAEVKRLREEEAKVQAESKEADQRAREDFVKSTEEKIKAIKDETKARIEELTAQLQRESTNSAQSVSSLFNK